MKKILLTVASAIMLFSACKKEDNKTNPEPNPGGNGNNNPPQEIVVPETNVSLVNKLTGSLCGPCGSWGWQGFEQIMTLNGKNAVYMGTYSQNFVAQLFITQVATDMDAMFRSEGYPTFVANGTAMLDRTNNVNIESELDKVDAAIAAHSASPVYVNSGLRVSDSANIMTVETRTKFFQEVGGDLYLAVYLTEDKVKGYQASHADGANTQHHHVLRAAGKLDGSSKAESFGYKINTSSTTAANTVLDNKFTFDISGYNKENLEATVVVWRKVGVRYKFINAYSNKIK